MDGSFVRRNVEKYLSVLAVALRLDDAFPRRRFRTFDEFKSCLKAEKELKVDVTGYRSRTPAKAKI